MQTATNFCNEIISKFNNSNIADPYRKISEIIPSSLKNNLPMKRRRKNDWFTESKDRLLPLIANRNQLCNAVKHTNTLSNRIELKYARQRINSETKKAKNKWLHNLTEQINLNTDKSANKKAWTALKSLEKGHSNIRKSSSTNLRKPDKSLCSTPQENAETFEHHFTKLFDKPAQNPDTKILSLFTLFPPTSNAEALPSRDDTLDAIKRLNNTAAGPSEILSTVWKCLSNNDATLQMILNFVMDFWSREVPPHEWNIGNLKILPKKGDLHNTNNYRGIMLLETAYKIIANIIRSRLIPIAESIDQESQCGFRPGRSTIDSIFSLKSVLKKRKEHNL